MLSILNNLLKIYFRKKPINSIPHDVFKFRQNQKENGYLKINNINKRR